jgi:hypothetical protein
VQLTPTEEDEAMKKGGLTVKREQELQHLHSLLDEAYRATGGRGKWWQAVKRAITLLGAGARKARKHSA